MGKDNRLYMTFPNDFWMHPKVAPLSINAKWAFVEMNGYSRMQDLDGSIPVAMAERLWAREVLDELVGSHPARPLVVLVEGAYVIRDYAKHQQTTADRDALSAVRSEAGRRGRAQQLRATGANAGQVPRQTRAETETESLTTPKGVVARKRGTRIPDPFVVTGDMRRWAADNCPAVDVDRSTTKFVNHFRAATRNATKLDWPATWRNWLMNDADRNQSKPTPTERALRTLQLATEIELKGIES